MTEQEMKAQILRCKSIHPRMIGIFVSMATGSGFCVTMQGSDLLHVFNRDENVSFKVLITEEMPNE